MTTATPSTDLVPLSRTEVALAEWFRVLGLDAYEDKELFEALFKDNTLKVLELLRRRYEAMKASGDSDADNHRLNLIKLIEDMAAAGWVSERYIATYGLR